MLGEPKCQFSLTRTASTNGRSVEPQSPIGRPSLSDLTNPGKVMKKNLSSTMAAALAAAKLWAADPTLTIYSQQFAVVRDKLHLDFKCGLVN